MRLAWIEMREVRMRLLHPFETSFGREEDKDFLLVRVSDGAEEGWGECAAMSEPLYNEETTAGAALMIKDHIVPRLWGEMESPEEVYERLRPIRGNALAKAAVEEAVWDLSARRAGVSLKTVLGGVKERVPVGISLGIESDLGQLLEGIEERLAEGYARIKVKIKPGWDLATVEAIRNRFGNIPLQVDANSCYTLADIPMLKALDQFGLLLIEQPLAHDDIVDHATLQKALLTPICLDESIHSAEDALKAIRLGAMRVLNVKVGRLGGLAESRRAVEVCRRSGVDVWCGGMLESGVGRAINLAVQSLPGFNLPSDTSATSRYWAEDITEPPVIVGEGGLVEVPDDPGLGVRVIPDRLESRTTAKERWVSP